jgi:glycosyltransferase involved in cell wall biosynthesis
MRILHVLEALEAGASRHLRYVVGHVNAEHIVVIPPERVGGLTDDLAFEDFARAGAEVHLVPMRRSPKSAHNAAAMARVRRIIKERRPDVVHGHSSIGGALARVAMAGTGVPCVYTSHGLFPSLSAMAIERALGRFTDRFIALSPSEVQLVRQLRLVPPERIVMVPNGIELEPPPPASYDLREKLAVAPGTPIVGTVGRLAPQKAPEIFVRACAEIARRDAETCFVLVGDGPLADVVQHEIDAAGIASRFLLLRGCNDGPSLMSQFDVFALPSRYEASAYAPLEAMRAGAAMVVSDVAGNHEMIDDGRTGLLVPPDDPGALADAVVSVLDDPTRRAALVAAAREQLVERYDVAVLATRLLDVYRSVVSEGARATAVASNVAPRRLETASQRKFASTWRRAALASVADSESDLSSSLTA